MSSKKSFLCPRCEKSFSSSSNRSKHVRQVHDNERLYACVHCSKSFKRNHDKAKHEQKCKIKFLSLPQTQPVTTQLRIREKRKGSEDATFDKPETKKTRVSDTQVEELDPITITDNLMPADPELRDIFKNYWSAIRTHFHKTQRIQDIFNYRLVSNSTIGIESALITHIFEQQACSFKIDIDFGFLLRHNETGKMRYYHSCQNNSSVLPRPHLVKDRKSFDEFLVSIRNVDILEWARQQRPDTKWVVEMVTNVTFFVNKILKFPIGARVTLPSFVLNNPGIIALQKDENNSFDYVDNLCLFRCISMGFGESSHSLSSTTKALFHRFVGRGAVCDTFQGVTLDQLPRVEKVFSININVYALKHIDMNESDGRDYGKSNNHEEIQNVVVNVVRRSLGQYDKTINLNLFEKHFSFIRNFELYSKRYACRICNKLWKCRWNMEKHEMTCEAKIKRKYVGGVYHVLPTVFEELEEEGIFVDNEMRFYPYCATYDFESYFKKSNLPSSTDKQEWLAEHSPLSVSICSNVDGFTLPTCYVSEGSSKELVFKMLSQLQLISDTAYKTMLQNFEHVFEEIDEALDDHAQREPQCAEKQTSLAKLRIKLEAWMKELPVFSFNGGRYDINLIKPDLVHCLLQQNLGMQTIKKKNNFMNIKTETLNFLDISNFLAPGFSYDKFLRAYKCPVNKGFLPYEWIDDLEKLGFPSLPPHESFYSSLKKENISIEDYTWCQKLWTDHDMKTFKDFLIFYNNRDVEPFVQGVLKMSQFYRQNGIDMMKDGISVPGLTMRYLFQNLPRDTYFTLFDEKNSDLHHLVKDNITGGPSIIFHRYHEIGKTKIREISYGETAKPCQSIVGFDANALYLNCLMQDMPTGWFVRRRAPDFKAEASHKYGRMALEWLEFEAARDGVEIRHMFNGKEKRVGARNLPVDGACKDTNTIYELNGCFWHGHECYLNVGRSVNEVRGKTMRELREETKSKADYIRQLGFNLKEMWECEWLALKKTPIVKAFLNRFLPREMNRSKLMTEQDILQCVKEDRLFGMVECDIEVPLCLREHFSEMQPIFKNVKVSKDDIGVHMNEHANRYGYLKQPRRMLIGSYFGKSILLATPLLRWYLSHGLCVTKIYQVIEYERKACFKTFGDNVSSARRAGDCDPEKAIVADTMKLLGNSGYGKTVTNKENHRDVKFVYDDFKASELVNEQNFRRLNQLSESLYEMEMSKKAIKLDLPLHIGFFVYQYAKLRMLQFYYDFLDKFVDRRDYQHVAMDTDSAYLSLSATSLENVVKPEMKREFYNCWENWLPAEACSNHKESFVEAKMSRKKWVMSNKCCQDRYTHDKRSPGLFKIEWEGEGIIGLCSKTYYCFGPKDKLSCKGLNKKQNDLRKEEYLKVLKEGRAGKGVNQGFRLKDNKILTYRETRAGLSYFYPKRIVSSDGISTHPIDI